MSAPQQPGPESASPFLVKELRRGQRVNQVFLVENSNFKQTRNNKFFIQTDLRDRTGSIKGIRWEADRQLFESFRASDYVHVAGRVEEFQQNLQIIIDAIDKVSDENVDIENFLPVSRKDLDLLEREFDDKVNSVEDPHLKELLDRFRAEPSFQKSLRRCPAGKALHHAWIGGLLEHIVSLCNAVDLLVTNYPQLNRDLLVTGAILHDIGKTRELSYDRSFGYSDEGQMIGHIAIAISWTERLARDIAGFPSELLTQVLHLIASHHGEPEYGAVKKPMTQEALALHYLDNLDAKLCLFETVQREQQLGDGKEEHWSDWHPAMGRRLYFP